MSPDPSQLRDLLRRIFGFSAFRANQEAVCQAATEGRDVLLVMPTGAGKSLCYQLPAIARGGTALVISPLIALMDDQAAKLTAAGLNVARIHSGLPRDDARQACRAYLDGTLQFLFIAPERLRIPGFPEMLARKKPALIAIDEAHCISAWGHDFRPDYRTLGEYLPSLRPAPVIALTATATPTVQRDIVAQLQLADPALFIHGFRRSNLHIEVVEMSKPRRGEFVTALLKKPENRPAIVYAPSRKASEELASLLGSKAAVYHAGLDPGTRERVQRHFQAGQLEVVVATIAFGMGIDKADVRTVVHIALPASVEAYYQEIGRAGRDGLPSRTVLLHSFADRKMHDFFLDRDYPPLNDLSRLAALLNDQFQMPQLLAQRLKMPLEVYEKAAEKLASQGVAERDMDGHLRAAGKHQASSAWIKRYEAQIAFRRSQIDRMVAFAESTQCRMAALVQHFGDTADGLRPCGHCDFCAPQNASASPFREPSAPEDRHLRAILAALKGGISRSTGKLHTDLALTPDRKRFDAYLDALSRAGLLTLNSDTFTNPEGTSITYKKATLTHEGAEVTPNTPLHALLRETEGGPKTSSKSKPGNKTSKPDTAPYTPAQQTLDTRLREWRKAEAAKTGKPAFIVSGDATLRNLVLARPQTLNELLTVSGIGPEKADRYGADLLAIFRGGSEPPETSALPTPTPTPPRPLPGRRKLSASEQTKQDLQIAAEDLKPISLKTPAGRQRAHAYDAAAYRRVDLETDLRAFVESQALLLNQTVEKLLSEAAIEDILRFRPTTVADLTGLENMRGDLPSLFLDGLLKTVRAEYKAQAEPLKHPKQRLNAVDTVSLREPSGIYTRQGSTPEPNRPLTPAQDALNSRLHAWRKAEAEKLGLPQFFVLSSSTLRSIVLQHPRSLDHLQTIPGIGAEKLDRFGPAILAACSA